MKANKIIRSICLFRKNPTNEDIKYLDKLVKPLKEKNYQIQTIRICSPVFDQVFDLDQKYTDDFLIFSIGSLEINQINKLFTKIKKAKNISFNLDLTKEKITEKEVDILYKIIKIAPELTFNFAYVFNNTPLTPYFPAASYIKDGFTIGLQPTNLAKDCTNLNQWFSNIKQVWTEILTIFNQNDFLGIDTSIAPFNINEGSFVNFIKKLGYKFSYSTTTDIYLQISAFIKTQSPKPVGLCGLMFPCLEDFELSDEYEKGNFSIERNLFLSLHSGLGIDTYPIGVDEKKQRVLEILKTVQGLSNKYKKPLSVRFASDGRSKIGLKSDFQNQYLKDVVIRPL